MVESEEQQKISKEIISWYKDIKRLFNCQYTTIGGYAGTGKTFLISIISKELRQHSKIMNVAFATFTGKASSVLKKRLLEARGTDIMRATRF